MAAAAAAAPPLTPATATRPAAAAATGAAPAAVRDEPFRLAARFSRPSALLAFLGTLSDRALTGHDQIRRSNGHWWTEIAEGEDTIADLIFACGGIPYRTGDVGWIAMSSSGSVRAATGDQLDVSSWDSATIVDAFCASGLPSARYVPTSQLFVVAPGGLARFILRRTSTLGISVTLMPARWRPLNGDGGAESSVLLMHLRATSGVIPASLVHVLAGLPHTIVGTSLGLDPANVIASVGNRSPIPLHLLSRLVPHDDVWVLGPEGIGHWRLHVVGREIDGATFLDLPELTHTVPPPIEDAALPAPIPVRVIHAPTQAATDAVLVDDAELVWLRSVLMGRPSGDVAFLIPGAGRHLVLVPGGLTTTLPFGTPLTRVGPGGLYLELARAFHPPMPSGARRERFQLSEDTVVVVTQNGAYRFSLEHLLPAWALWVGSVPTVTDELSPAAKQLIDAVSKELKTSTRKESRKFLPRRGTPMPHGELDRSTRLAEAMRLELSGDLVGAAKLLEQAGEPGRAGRLFERAALGE